MLLLLPLPPTAQPAAHLFLRLLFSTRSLDSSPDMSSSCSPMSFILAFCGCVNRWVAWNGNECMKTHDKAKTAASVG